MKSFQALAHGLTVEDMEIFCDLRLGYPETVNRDVQLMGSMAYEQATSEVPRAERMRAYAWLGVSADEQRIAEKGGEYVETIDLTPTWRMAAAVLIAVLEDGDAEGKRLAREEVLRMASVLDALIAERGHKGPVATG